MARRRTRPNEIPLMAIPVSLKGEAACAFADELGISVYTMSASGDGTRPITTADARAFFAVGRSRNYGAAWDEVVWLTVAYDVTRVLQPTGAL